MRKNQKKKERIEAFLNKSWVYRKLNTTQSWLNSKHQKTVLFLGLIVSFIIVIYSLSYLNDALNPNQSYEKLILSNSVRELRAWNMSVRTCESNSQNIRTCFEVPTTHATTNLPGRMDLANSISEIKKQNPELKNKSLLFTVTHEFSQLEKEWIQKKKNINLFIPTSIQKYVKLILPDRTLDTTGSGFTVHFSFPSSSLMNENSITLEFDPGNMPWFGPAVLPVLLAENGTQADLQSLATKQAAMGTIMRLFFVFLPVLFACIAVVLDHNRAFALLSFYGIATAARAFVPLIIKNQSDLQNWGGPLFSLLNGAAFFLLILFSFEMSHLSNLRRYAWPIFAFFSASFFLIFNTIFSEFYLVADLWCDGLSASLSIGILLCGIIKNPKTLKMDMRLAVLILAYMIHIQANVNDLFHVEEDRYKDLFDWKHLTLLPLMLVSCLAEVGSVTRRIRSVSKNVREKARIDTELAIARRTQLNLLPGLKFTSEKWSWRAFFKPASELAGDWFDAREIKFSDGRTLLAVALVDVTGHGISAALSTTIISSTWGCWCEESTSWTFPETPQQRELLLAHAPARLHKALVSNRHRGSGTAVCALLDWDKGEVTLTTAGHPPVIVSDNYSVREVRGRGSTLGSFCDVENLEWKCVTTELIPGEYVIFMSDGIFSSDMERVRWMSTMRRKSAAGKLHLLAEGLLLLKNTKHYFRKNPDEEDDMTALLVRWHAPLRDFNHTRSDGKADAADINVMAITA